MNSKQLKSFVVESNKIEGILREPTQAELDATLRFLYLEEVDLLEMQALVKTYSGAELRNERGMNVRVGRHEPPPGGSTIELRLEVILRRANAGEEHPHVVHHDYETLHPFMDGNGRSGRALWVWMMRDQGLSWARRGFLHIWYYQSLDYTRRLRKELGDV